MGNGSTRARADRTRIAIAPWLGVDEVIAGGETGPDDFFFQTRKRTTSEGEEKEQLVARNSRGASCDGDIFVSFWASSPPQ